MAFALWYRVPTTLYFDGIVQWISNCKYRSVCVGFLYTDVMRLPSSLGVMRLQEALLGTGESLSLLKI